MKGQPERLSWHLGKVRGYYKRNYYIAIPLLGMYLKKNTIRKDTCTPVLIAALLTIAKTWKQAKRPSAEEWTEETWNVYTQNITQ